MRMPSRTAIQVFKPKPTISTAIVPVMRRPSRTGTRVIPSQGTTGSAPLALEDRRRLSFDIDFGDDPPARRRRLGLSQGTRLRLNLTPYGRRLLDRVDAQDPNTSVRILERMAPFIPTPRAKSRAGPYTAQAPKRRPAAASSSTYVAPTPKRRPGGAPLVVD